MVAPASESASDPAKPGCLFLFGEPGNEPRGLSGDELTHQQYAKHICGEVEVEEVTNGLVKRYWKKKNENHWLDASAYCNVAASIEGIRLMGESKPTRPPPGERPTARDLARDR